VSKNSPSTLKIGCKPPFNLVELIQTYLDSEEDLEKLEDLFE
jgi:hypothetical protein